MIASARLAPRRVRGLAVIRSAATVTDLTSAIRASDSVGPNAGQMPLLAVQVHERDAYPHNAAFSVVHEFRPSLDGGGLFAKKSVNAA